MGSSTMIKILLMKGANIEIREEHRLTPLDIAVRQGHTKTIRILISRRAKTDHLVESDPSVTQRLKKKVVREMVEERDVV